MCVHACVRACVCVLVYVHACVCVFVRVSVCVCLHVSCYYGCILSVCRSSSYLCYVCSCCM